jgi:hypothetical protein
MTIVNVVVVVVAIAVLLFYYELNELFGFKKDFGIQPSFLLFPFFSSSSYN